MVIRKANETDMILGCQLLLLSYGPFFKITIKLINWKKHYEHAWSNLNRAQ